MIEEEFPVEYENLEKILALLPEPTSAKVSIFGEFDYSSIYNQAKEINSNLGLKLESSESKYEILNPSKEIILDIYKKSYLNKGAEKGTKQIILEEVKWLQPNYTLELTPYGCIKIKCGNNEPSFLQEFKKLFRVKKEISVYIT